jgi:hypothetical protein
LIDYVGLVIGNAHLTALISVILHCWCKHICLLPVNCVRGSNLGCNSMSREELNDRRLEKMHNEEPYNLYSLPDLIRMMT